MTAAHHLHPAAGPHALFAQARRYIGAISHRVGRRYRLDPDEMFNEMALGLLARADRYDPARGSPEAFAGVQLRPALDRLRHTRSVPTEPLGPDDDRLGQVAGTVPDPADAADRGERLTRLREAIENLPARHRRAVDLRFGLGDGAPMSLDEVGAAMGVSGEMARRLIAAGVEKLRAELADPGE